jgi:hypothetical protein
VPEGGDDDPVFGGDNNDDPVLGDDDEFVFGEMSWALTCSKKYIGIRSPTVRINAAVI